MTNEQVRHLDDCGDEPGILPPEGCITFICQECKKEVGACYCGEAGICADCWHDQVMQEAP